MSDPSSDSPPERLLTHEPWLGALARRLVRDEEEARDVVQETMRRALDAPPREEHALRSFLGSIARHFVYDGARRRRRREARERRAARPELQPATVDLLTRLDRQRDVLDEVLRLPEPFRETILLRFYEERKPRQIAKLLDVPVATVKSRIRRGQDRLRERMRERYGEREWRAALAPLLVLPPLKFSMAALSAFVALTSVTTVVAGAWQVSMAWRGVERAAEPAPGVVQLAVPALPAMNADARNLTPLRADRRASAATPPPRAVAQPNSKSVVPWPEDTLLWIDLKHGLVSAPAQELCQLRSELLASPEAVIDALAAGRSDVMFLPLSGTLTGSAATSADQALVLHVLDATGRPAEDLPVCVLWRGASEQRVLWRGRTHDGLVHAPMLQRAIERLMPHGEVIATFDFPLADVRACVLNGTSFLDEAPCLQAPASGAVELSFCDPWGVDLPPGACAILRTRQPDGTTWEHPLAWHAGRARFGPIAFGAEVEVEVRTLDLPVAVHRLPPLHPREPEPHLRIVAGELRAACEGRLVLPEDASLDAPFGIAELSDTAGRILGHWRYDLDARGHFHFALIAPPDPAQVTHLRLRVGTRRVEVPFAFPAAGQHVALGELVLEDLTRLAQGRVLNEVGDVVADALVRIERQSRGEHGEPKLWIPEAKVRTGADGRFELWGAAASYDRFQVAVEYPDTYSERVAVQPGFDLETELTVRKGGHIEGLVELGTDLDARSIAVLIYPSTGPHRVGTLGSDGSFRIAGIPPGLARVELIPISGDARPIATFAPCCVMADAVVTVGQLSLLGRVRAIERRILDADGPCAQRVFELRAPALEHWSWRGRSDAEGRIQVLLPVEIDQLDLYLEGSARLRFSTRAALDWIDLVHGVR